MTKLKQAARQLLIDIAVGNGTDKSLTALREALEAEQAEQEPVAWISSSCPKCSNKVRGTLGSGYMWRCAKCNFEWPVEAAAPVSIEAAVLAEREACANVCDQRISVSHDVLAKSTAGLCAAAIRARGEK